MIITRSTLLRAVPALYKPRLDEFVASFNMWAVPFGIDTPQRMVHYLAQVFHESGSLRYVEEIASGKDYEGHKDLGNTQPGDGRRFKGRGFIQLTGRANYQRFCDSDLCTEDVVAHPEKVAQYPLNQVASMWFWHTNGLNGLADLDDGGTMGEDIVTRITRRVNGGLNHLADRKYLYRKFKKEFGL